MTPSETIPKVEPARLTRPGAAEKASVKIQGQRELKMLRENEL